MFDHREERRNSERQRYQAEQTDRKDRRTPELDEQGIKSAEPGSEAADLMNERHSKLMECLADERDRQAENRLQMAKDEDYYDGLQWEPEDAQLLMDRGQAPLVFNKVKPSVEWLLGTEKRTRIDFKVLPREQDDEQGAEVKTKALKYVSDVNSVPFHRSAAFKECVVAGAGWLEDGATTDPEEDIIFSGSVSWRDIIRDSRSRALNYNQDARYLFRQRTVDADIVRAMFPHAATHLDEVAGDDQLVGSVDDETWYLGERLTNSIEVQNRGIFGERSAYVSTSYVDGGRREAVRLLHIEYRVPEPAPFFASGQLAGKPFNHKDPLHVQLKRAGAAVVQHVALRMRSMIATERAPLWDGPSPYKHNKFSYTPIWCYRRARDGEPYGIVRGIRDIQDDFNKRRSKALHILSTNRIVMDKGAVDDVEELRQEAARADAVIAKNPGLELRFEKPMAEVQGNFELMQQDDALMQDVSGISGELRGQETSAQSGKAIIAKQEQGSMVTAGIFDNLRMAIQQQGEKQLSLVEQFYTEPKVLRIVGERKPTEWLAINTKDEATGRILNDITARKADFVVSEQDYRANLQQAAFEQLGDMLTKVASFAPQVVVNLLDLLVDLADIPNKSEFVGRIRKMTGQTDPTKPPTPEEVQALKMAEQQAQADAELQRRQAMAQLRNLEATADSVKAKSILARVQAMLAAMDAGAQVATVPGVAPVADEIMGAAGFKDLGAPGSGIADGQPMPQPQPQPMPPSGMTTGGVMPA